MCFSDKGGPQWIVLVEIGSIFYFPWAVRIRIEAPCWFFGTPFDGIGRKIKHLGNLCIIIQGIITSSSDTKYSTGVQPHVTNWRIYPTSNLIGGTRLSPLMSSDWAPLLGWHRSLGQQHVVVPSRAKMEADICCL